MNQKAVTWLILAVVLVVPAVLFYNWLGKMKAQTTPTADYPRKQEAASSTGTAAATPFTPSQASTAAAAPSVPQEPAQAQNPPPQLASMAAPADPAATAAAAPPAQSAPPAPDQAQPAPAPQDPAQAQSPQTAQPPRKLGEKPIEYAPSTSRDPTISPIDIKNKMLEAEKAEIIRREKEEALQRMREGPKRTHKERPAEPPIEERIQLYGIVSTPSGKAAIVNDGTAYEGDTVMGAVIKRITTNTVFFQYRGKTFSKKITK